MTFKAVSSLFLLLCQVDKMNEHCGVSLLLVCLANLPFCQLLLMNDILEQA